MTRPFENAVVGDMVYHLAYGQGKVIHVDRDTLIYRPITAKDSSNDSWINKDGYTSAWNSNVINRVLYLNKPKIIEQ
jgi:hypothetical protein